MQHIELKPCPFCGGPAAFEKKIEQKKFYRDSPLSEGARLVRTFTYNRYREAWKNGTQACETRTGKIVELDWWMAGCTCSSCAGRMSRRYKSPERAAEVWNRRANDGT